MNKYAGTILLDCRIPLAADLFFGVYEACNLLGFVGFGMVYIYLGDEATSPLGRNTYLVHWSRNELGNKN
jgi:hypothetical protein